MEAKKGNKIKVHYTVKEATGEEIESSYDTMPIEFIIGEGGVIPGFENGVIGMKENETKTINVPCDEAYGPRDETKTFEFSNKSTPPDFDPRIGDMVQLHRPDGKAFSVKVLEKRSTGYLMDANHPLVGKDLIFDLKLIEIIE